MTDTPLGFDPKNILDIDENPLLRESDRGAVLALSFDIENILTELLKEWFTHAGDLTSEEERNIFNFTGPLGTFSAKICLSKAIGLLESNIYSDIQHIRKIRNLAAHSDSSFSLSGSASKSHLSSLKNMPQKLEDVKRYSVRNHEKENDTSEMNEESESFLKGFGLLRYDKVRFIAASRVIEKKLRSLKPSATMMANTVKEIRKREKAND